MGNEILNIFYFVLVAILCPIILSIIGNITTNPVENILIKLFGSFSLTPDRKLRGLWIIRYSYKSGNEQIEDFLLINVKQIGKNIVATTKNLEYGKYYLKGDVHLNI